MTACANTSYLRAYEQEQVEQDLRAERVTELIDFFMGAGQEFDPFDAGNIAEFVFVDFPLAEIGDLLRAEDACAAGQLLMEKLVVYWRGRAEAYAQREVERGDA